MAVNFTKEQQQAIDLHGCDILVSAAAGSGKTAVLTQRIVNMVCRKENPVDIDRLLVATFTKAAADEMRERISQAIMAKLQEDPENEHLQRQAAIISNAQITTIDSFCMFILRNNFEDIGLDPAFRIADEGEVKLLARDVMKEMLGEHFENGDEAFIRTVEYFSPKGKESDLENSIMDIYEYAMSNPFPEQWIEERKKDYVYDSVNAVIDSPEGKFFFNYVKKLLQGVREDLAGAEKICEEPDGPYPYGCTMEEEGEMLDRILSAKDLCDLCQLMPLYESRNLKRASDNTISPDKKDMVKKIHDNVKDTMQKIKNEYFALPFESIVRQSKVVSKAVNTLMDLTIEFKHRLDEKKAEKKILNFSDAEHYALQVLLNRDENGALKPTPTALEYRDYFEEVFIDEYQDVNLVQEYLLKAVSRDDKNRHNRFMVGDVKQSIYKFRLARPELFLEKYDTYSETDGLERKINLHQNFRSRPQVIDSVNAVFSKIMKKELGGIEYDDKAALYAGAVYLENSGCESEMFLVEKPGKESGLNARQAEALFIACKIKKLVSSFQVTDKESGALRNLHYKDIVILLRTTSEWDESFKEVLESEGIPVYVEGKNGYFSTTEIRDVLLFLKVIDNPLQDIPLYFVMKSVFGGFTETEIAALRQQNEKYDNLYTNLKAHAASDEQSKYAKFLAVITRYRSYASYMTILELLQTLFQEFDYLPYVAALPAGEKRLANVEMLLTKAAVYEQNSYYGLFHFIRYMEQLEKCEVDYGEAATLDENADVVRIMSIHKSKGLEFPVTIVAGLAKGFNENDLRAPIIMDNDLGIGLPYVNIDTRVKSKTFRKNVLTIKNKLDILAEELRILYVAMTRAKEKLILTACTDKPEKKIAAAEKDLTYTKLTGAKSYLDYLLPAWEGIHVVTSDELAGLMVREATDRNLRTREFFINEAAKDVDMEVKRKLKERFSFVYPYENLRNLYTKTTVSELKMAALEEKEETAQLFPEKEVVPYVPAFMRKEEKINGTTRGSAMHRLMELLDLTAEYKTSADVIRAMEAFTLEGRLSGEYAQAIRTDKILHFLHTPLAKRMGKAQENHKLYREQPFVYGVDAGNGETVLIQGIVDAYFEEEDGIVLLDYKTDVVETGDELVERYQTQIDYYEKALHGLTGKRIKERILYSFYLGCEVQV